MSEDDARALRARIDDVLGPDDAQPVALLHRYFRSEDEFFTGRWFDRLGREHGRDPHPNTLTADDLVAVTFLSIAPKNLKLELLKDLRPQISQLLVRIPQDLDLVDAAGEHINDESAASELWALLRKVDGIDWVIANKILARKRPRLIPVYDSVVRDALTHPRAGGGAPCATPSPSRTGSCGTDWKSSTPEPSSPRR